MNVYEDELTLGSCTRTAYELQPMSFAKGSTLGVFISRGERAPSVPGTPSRSLVRGAENPNAALS
jgi:hypothetical protein